MEAVGIIKVDRIVVVNGVADKNVVSDSISVTNGELMTRVVAITKNNVGQLEFSTANLATFPFHLQLFTVLD